MEGDCRGVPEKEVDVAEEIKVREDNITSNKILNQQEKKKKMKKKKNRRSLSFPRFGCLRTKSHENGGVDMEVQFQGERNNPTHLVIMVNGIIGSAQNWRFAAKQLLKKYPENVIVHCEYFGTPFFFVCSERNSSTLTFDGVDVMGDRLAEEVKHVISCHPSVQKISFVGHSLGGLVARYAIARLYEQDLTQETSQTNGDCGTDHLGDKDLCPEGQLKGKIAGLEPMNFITFASPHLGSLWHKQFCSGVLQASCCVCKCKVRPYPFIISVDSAFMFSLHYQFFTEDLIIELDNLTLFLDIVGWSTSSLRRRNELPKIKHLPRSDRYPHVINVEPAKTATLDEIPTEAKINGDEKINMEEEMIRGLTKLSWERVDVYFKGSRQRILAHSTIQASYSLQTHRPAVSDRVVLFYHHLVFQVKSNWVNSDGADVVQHMIDNFLL
ncbi:hypothetical protein Gotri_014416 [Gossypium trilobum]|uniref:DUF676 domain-containing protein n=1 Tax=Gossypium trilobum TaxID=34281 RepID=A0A7J9DWN3_9ROSI|nr:hypothetical protein [Gossypium trilobum]